MNNWTSVKENWTLVSFTQLEAEEEVIGILDLH